VVKIITSSADVLDLGINSFQNNLLITKDAQSALQLIEYFDGDPNFVLLENSELLPYDFFSMAPIIRAKRITALSSLLKRKGVTLISSINTILSPLPHPSHISPINNLSVNDQFNPEKIIQEITDYGYIREDFVSEPGQYALRGSIMDIFLTSGKNPIRIEFFDNTIESIRTFNPESQIADEKIDSLNFLPSFEYPLNPEAAEIFKQEWRKNFDIFENDSEIFTKVMSLRPAEGVEIYLPLFYKQKASVLSYLNHIDEICVQKHTDIKAYAFEDLIKERYEEYRYDLRRPLLAPEDLFLNFSQLTEYINKDKSFDFEQPNIAETTENSIKLARNEKADISSSKMPDPGDLVVHLSHGIGRFVG